MFFSPKREAQKQLLLFISSVPASQSSVFCMLSRPQGCLGLFYAHTQLCQNLCQCLTSSSSEPAGEAPAWQHNAHGCMGTDMQGEMMGPEHEHLLLCCSTVEGFQNRVSYAVSQRKGMEQLVSKRSLLHASKGFACVQICLKSSACKKSLGKICQQLTMRI